MRRIVVGCAIVALGFVLSSCELGAEVSVNKDGSGTMGISIGIEPQYLSLLGQSNKDPFASTKKDLADDPVHWKVEEFKTAKVRGLHATFTFASVDELRAKLAAMSKSSASETGLKDFTLKREAGGGWSFGGKSQDVQSRVGKGISIPPDQLASLLKLQFRVTLPGKARSSNADETTSSGGRTTFIWRPSVKDESVAFQAATTPGGGLPMLPVAIAAALIALVGGVGFVRSRANGRPVADSVANAVSASHEEISP
jgi:phosphatidylinositol mannoside-binding LppM-like protein